MSISFLLQALKTIHNGCYSDAQIKMIHDYLENLDNEVLNGYLNSHQVLQYNNDLEFCIEIIDKTINILEQKEDYERCQVLLDKKNLSIKIINTNVEKYEHT